MLIYPSDYQDTPSAHSGVDLDAFKEKPVARRALIVDDDPDTVDLIKIIIRNAGMDVVGAFSGSEALQKCAELKPSVILLDLMMPGMDGWDTFYGIRRITDAPVIGVTADNKKESLVKGLNMGFDDYVTKPFFPPELVARVNTVLRRTGTTQPVTVRVFPEAGISIDFETHEVTIGDRSVELSPREFAILAVLTKKAPRMVRYEEIATEIWGEDNLRIRNRIKYLIYLLRQKLETDPNNPQLILNREGLGYQLNIDKKT
ncbi:MAG TPA: response regulator transcription factor [Anaerolineales bacterium]|nr:response regulator transcription factor [Anaerolineales bacterium]